MMAMTTDQDAMPAEVAQALLAYKKSLPADKWTALKAAFFRARGSYSATMALQVAEKAIFKGHSSRPPA